MMTVTIGHDQTSRRGISNFMLLLSIVSSLASAYRMHRYGGCDDTPIA